MAEQEGIVLPDFVSADWIISQLRISDDDAAKIGKELSVGDPSWEFVKDKATFAEQFLERFVDDPAIAAECRRVLGKKSPPVFAVPNSDPNAPGMLSARKCFGQYAARAHAALTSGDADTALDCIMLELLEFGGVAEEGFKFAQDVQHRDEYKQLVDIATKIQQRGYEIGLREDGLEAAEAEAEARSLVRQEYSFGKLAMLAESVSTSDTPVATLSKVAHALAEAARDATAYVQISTAPLGTDTAIVGIKEAVSILEAHLHGSEDAELFELADQGKKLADSAQVQLLDRSIVCDARQRVAQIREKALEASSAADAAAAVPVKSMADAKKMAQAFEKANTLAKEACTMAIDCATILNEAKPIEPVDKAKELFEGIAAAFRGAEKGAAEETKKSADAAAAAQQEAKEASAQLDKEAAKAKVEKKAQAAKAKADEGKAEAEKGKAAEQLAAAKAKAEQEAVAAAQEKAAEAEKKDAAPAKPEPAAKKQEAAPPAAAEQQAEPEKQDAAPTSRLGKLAAAVSGRKAKRAAAAQEEEAAPPAQEKQAAPEPAPEAAAEEEPAGPSSEELREKLLAELDKFAGKRWDTDVATHALRRLVDRRKEIIGQLWEAVENKSPDMVDRSDKFAQKFRNTMDARRRLDAVVRIVGRGKHMDPRTAKWFTDQIIAISKAAAAFADSA